MTRYNTTDKHKKWSERILLALVIVALCFVMAAIFSILSLEHELSSFYSHQREEQVLESYFRELLDRREESHRKEIAVLKNKVVILREQISGFLDDTGETEPMVENKNSLKDKILALAGEDLKQNNKDNKETFGGNNYPEQSFVYDQKVNSAEILHGVQHISEFHVEPYKRFDLEHVYTLGQGLGKRAKEKLFGRRKQEIMEILEESIQYLNMNRSGLVRINKSHFWDGVFRTEATIGTHYEVYFKIPDSTEKATLVKVGIMRPFGPLILVDQSRYAGRRNETIHVIVPLHGRLGTFRKYLSDFVTIAIKADGNVGLIVVLFGEEEAKEVKTIMDRMKKIYKFAYLNLVVLNQTFSRARAFDAGVKSLGQKDALIFLCDVDVVFDAKFLTRCRLNSEKGRKVYYPIVFSLYNPHVVYTLDGKATPSRRINLRVENYSGFWRDFGFGMSCQYKSDFEFVGGFGGNISGWGMEDVFLYRKYIRSSKYIVIRAADNGIFHTYHEKHCNSSLSEDQYNGCIRSKALNEASHAQLGQLAFKSEIDLRKARKIRRKH